MKGEAARSNARMKSPEREDLITRRRGSRSRSPSGAVEWKPPRDAGLKRLLKAHQAKREKARVRQRKFAQKLRATTGERSILELNSVKEPTRKDYLQRLEKFYVCPLSPVGHQPRDRTRRGAVRLRRPAGPQWGELFSRAKASSCTGVCPARSSQRAAVEAAEVLEGAQRMEADGSHANQVANAGIRQECHFGSLLGTEPRRTGAFQRDQLLHLRSAGRAPEDEGGGFRRKEPGFRLLDSGGGSHGEGRGLQGRDLRRGAHPGRQESALARAGTQAARGNPKEEGWDRSQHVGLQRQAVPAGMETSGGHSQCGGCGEKPVPKQARGREQRPPVETADHPSHSEKGALGFRQQCADLRQARQIAASPEPARKEAARLWGTGPPELRGLEPQWYNPDPGRDQAAHQGLQSKAYLSLFGGVAEGARFFAQEGGIAAVVDYEHSSRNNLSRMSAWNSILKNLHLFHAVGIDLPCNTWSRARRAPKNSRLPGPLRGETTPDIFGLLGLSEKDRQKVQDANCMLFGALKVIRKCLRLQIPGYLENPLTSRLWKTPGIQKLLQSSHVKLVKTDQCQYGSAWRKPTALLCWCSPAVSFARCTGKHGLCSKTRRPHVQLTGVACGKFLTQRAQVYSRSFARAIIDNLNLQ